MLQYNLDGLVVSCDRTLAESTCRMLVDNQIPALLLTESDMRYPLDSIAIKTELSVRLAVEHLIQLGHRKIGYLGEHNSDVRYQAFCEILKQNNIELNPNFVKRTEMRFEEGGYQVGCELMRERELPTAVVTSYDQIAFGAMRAFRERGIRIPEDMSIVGFDNIVMDEYYPVPLTSVTNPVEQMGITAVKILLDAIHKPTTHVVQNVSLQSRLVIRDSTCPPKETLQIKGEKT
jgi:DNA-binding LacI/PurR family transcriptional regulator